MFDEIHPNKMIQQENENHRIIREYIRDNKANYVRPHREVEMALSPSGEKLLCANSGNARIAMATSAHKALEDHLHACSREILSTVYFITLVPNKFAMPERTASEFKPNRLREWIEREMSGFNYLGMIEAGFYPKTKLKGEDTAGTISWHAHLIVWGTGLEEMERRLQDINARHSSLLEGAGASHHLKVSAKLVGKRLLYCMKSPQNRYSTHSSGAEITDPETGEIRQIIDKQKKRKLRSGERMWVCNIMRYQHLDRLIVGGGEGAALRKSIIKEALAPLKRSKEFKTAWKALSATGRRGGNATL